MTTLEDIARNATTAGLFVDFDGTLSPIVLRPEDARPAPEVPGLLRSLSSRLALVAVVSGRSAHQLVEWLGPEIEIWGLHGAERSVAGQVQVAAAVMPYMGAIRAARDEARARLEIHGLIGCTVEDKGSMIALHLRAAADPEAAGPEVERIARDIAARDGLIVAPGRMVFELRPPVEVSKRDVVLRRSEEMGLQAACFIGDDLVDVPAFEALDRLEAGGATCLRVAVRSDEAPAQLLQRADLIVDGTAGVTHFLSELDRLTTGV